MINIHAIAPASNLIAAPLRGTQARPCALDDQSALKLRERTHYVQHQAARGVRGVDGV
jgi:hypothetical protein